MNDDFLDRTFFRLPMVTMTDRLSGNPIDTRVTLDILAFACQECAHIDFSLPQAPASLQEVGKK